MAALRSHAGRAVGSVTGEHAGAHWSCCKRVVLDSWRDAGTTIACWRVACLRVLESASAVLLPAALATGLIAGDAAACCRLL